MKINLPDAIIAAFVLILIVLTAVFLYRNRTPATRVSIHTVSGEEIYPLTENRIWERRDGNGVVRIEIRDGTAAFIESYCRGKDCVRTGDIVGGSGAAACLPARVWMEVEGAENGADAQTY